MNLKEKKRLLSNITAKKHRKYGERQQARD